MKLVVLLYKNVPHLIFPKQSKMIFGAKITNIHSEIIVLLNFENNIEVTKKGKFY